MMLIQDLYIKYMHSLEIFKVSNLQPDYILRYENVVPNHVSFFTWVRFESDLETGVIST
jgi:hypothetical protein